MSERRIILNGQEKNIQVESLADLILSLSLPKQFLAVAVNNQVIPSHEHDTTLIHDGDCVEIINPTAGG